MLLSCALFLRKSEAANLRIGDIEVPIDEVTGKPVLMNGIPRYMYVHIRHSKTDQDRNGVICTCHLNVNNFILVSFRTKIAAAKKYQKHKAMPTVGASVLAYHIEVSMCAYIVGSCLAAEVLISNICQKVGIMSWKGNYQQSLIRNPLNSSWLL